MLVSSLLTFLGGDGLGGDGLIPCGGAFSLAGDGLFSFDSTAGLLVLTATLAAFTLVCLLVAPTVESLSSLTDLLGGLAPTLTSFLGGELSDTVVLVRGGFGLLEVVSLAVVSEEGNGSIVSLFCVLGVWGRSSDKQNVMWGI